MFAAKRWFPCLGLHNADESKSRSPIVDTVTRETANSTHGVIERSNNEQANRKYADAAAAIPTISASLSHALLASLFEGSPSMITVIELETLDVSVFADTSTPLAIASPLFQTKYASDFYEEVMQGEQLTVPLFIGHILNCHPNGFFSTLDEMRSAINDNRQWKTLSLVKVPASMVMGMEEEDAAAAAAELETSLNDMLNEELIEMTEYHKSDSQAPLQVIHHTYASAAPNKESAEIAVPLQAIHRADMSAPSNKESSELAVPLQAIHRAYSTSNKESSELALPLQAIRSAYETAISYKDNTEPSFNGSPRRMPSDFSLALNGAGGAPSRTISFLRTMASNSGTPPNQQDLIHRSLEIISGSSSHPTGTLELPVIRSGTVEGAEFDWPDLSLQNEVQDFLNHQEVADEVHQIKETFLWHEVTAKPFLDPNSKSHPSSSYTANSYTPNLL